MQHNTATIDDCEITFYLKQLKFRDLEQVISLVSEISQGAKFEAIKAIRQAMQICLAGWSLDKPIEDWDQEIDITQAIKLVNRCLQGNTPSETERKK